MRLKRSRRRWSRAFSKPSCSNRNRSRRPRGRKRKPNSHYSNSKRNNNSHNSPLKQLRMNPNKPNHLHQLINQSHKQLQYNSQPSPSSPSQPSPLNNSLKLQLHNLVRTWRSADSMGTQMLLHLLEQRLRGTLSVKRLRINLYSNSCSRKLRTRSRYWTSNDFHFVIIYIL